MKITDIRLQKSDPSRANLYIDGEFAFAVGLSLLADENLKVGNLLSEEALLRLRRLAAVSGAKRKGIDLLSRRMHSKKELEQKLKKSEKTREGAAAAADELEEKGYLDDFEYAKSMVRHFLRKSYGKRRIMDELFAKGVGREEIFRALEEEYGADEREVLRALFEKKFKAPQEGADKRRAAQFLARYGYETGDILWVLNGEYNEE